MPKWLDDAFNYSIPFSGYNPVTKIVTNASGENLYDPAISEQVKNHKTSLYVQITSFFKIPNALRQYSEPSFVSTLKDLFFIPDISNIWDVHPAYLSLCFVVGLAWLPFRLAFMIGGTLINILSLVTEVLPLSLQNLCLEKLGKNSILAKVFGVLHSIGRAITSPIAFIEEVIAGKKNVWLTALGYFEIIAVSLVVGVGILIAGPIVVPILVANLLELAERKGGFNLLKPPVLAEVSVGAVRELAVIVKKTWKDTSELVAYYRHLISLAMQPRDISEAEQNSGSYLKLAIVDPKMVPTDRVLGLQVDADTELTQERSLPMAASQTVSTADENDADVGASVSEPLIPASPSK